VPRKPTGPKVIPVTMTRAVRLAVVVTIIGGGVTALPTVAQAALVDATLIATRSTSTWERPSPDPSGITYNPQSGQLIISDGEVDEMPLYAGTNLFVSSLSGVQSAAFPGGTSLPWSDEPVGVSYKPGSGRLFVSDDDADRVFDVDPGSDGRYGTPDDTVTSFSTRPAGNGDAEDVTVDMDVTNNGHIIVVDGTDRKFYDYAPGPNGVFDGLPPGGDDTVQIFDVGQYGALDPEGIEYYPGRNTILVLDGGSKRIYEVTRQGALLNTISIVAANSRKAAGLTLAPASNGSGAEHVYIVDRGVDNDSNPNENDGRFYEMAFSLPPLSGGSNSAPVVGAGPDRTVTMPDAASLAGTVTDDGLPIPPGALTVSWAKVSGPGDVTFADAGTAATTATFSAAGSYVLRLTGNDGALQTSDEMSVVVGTSDSGPGGSGVLDVPVRAGADDAEQRSSSTSVTGGDLELVVDGSTVQTVGVRFTGVTVPRGATVSNAYVQFQADEAASGASSLTIAGQAADNPPGFTSAAGDVSSRPRTTAAVSWTPPDWPSAGARTVDQRTPNLAAVVQQIVSRSGWASGNALVLVVTGSGTRIAEPYEGGAARAPVLHIEYGSGTPGTTNTAPVVSAGPDRTVTMPAAASLTGSVTDDGLPDPPAATTAAWTKVTGPGTVTFASATSAATTATFSAAGSYLLRLTGSDSVLQTDDEVTVTVSAADPGGGGGAVAFDVPLRSSTDDAEQRQSTGAVNVTSGDLNLGQDGTAPQTAAMRFTGVAIPVGATVTSAWVQFQADEAGTAAAQLGFAAQAAGDAAAFTTTAGSISARPFTSARVSWSPPGWPTVGARTADQRTPNLASLLNEVVGLSGWAEGNAIVLLVTGTGERTAESFDGGAAKAPVLHVEYTP
jgi:hypothetical protein